MRVEKRAGSWLLGIVLLLALIFGLVAAADAARDLPLVEAARAADADAVRALLDRQVDVNTAETDGTTALHWAAYKGDVETAQLLLDAGADVETPNRPTATASRRSRWPPGAAALPSSKRSSTPSPTRTRRCRKARRC